MRRDLIERSGCQEHRHRRDRNTCPHQPLPSLVMDPIANRGVPRYSDILVFSAGSSRPLHCDFAILPSNGYTRAISGNLLSVCRATPQGRPPAWLLFTTTIIYFHPKATDDSFSKNRPLRMVFGTVRSIRGVSARSVHTFNLKRDVKWQKDPLFAGDRRPRLSDKGSVNCLPGSTPES